MDRNIAKPSLLKTPFDSIEDNTDSIKMQTKSHTFNVITERIQLKIILILWAFKRLRCESQLVITENGILFLL